jgi:hypothetical protein
MKHCLVFVVFGLCLTAFLRAEAGNHRPLSAWRDERL